MITIVNYGCGNIKAIQNVYHKLSITTKIAEKPVDMDDAEKLILPGVGAFDFAMKKLLDSGMENAINNLVLNKRIPVLGICVGAQLMTRSSEEGNLPGLGWVDASVKKFKSQNLAGMVNLPHMGWNDISAKNTNPLLEDLESDAMFYFLHSYYIFSDNPEQIIATSNYGGEFVCAVNNQNVYGVQFHPEKSHHFGVKLLENFALLVN